MYDLKCAGAIIPEFALVFSAPQFFSAKIYFMVGGVKSYSAVSDAS